VIYMLLESTDPFIFGHGGINPCVFDAIWYQLEAFQHFHHGTKAVY